MGAFVQPSQICFNRNSNKIFYNNAEILTSSLANLCNADAMSKSGQFVIVKDKFISAVFRAPVLLPGLCKFKF